MCVFVFFLRGRGVAYKRFDRIDFCLQQPCSVNYFVGIINRVDNQIFRIEAHGPFFMHIQTDDFIMVQFRYSYSYDSMFLSKAKTAISVLQLHAHTIIQYIKIIRINM